MDLKKLSKAIYFSAQKHSTQRRKDTACSPYINHPLDVLNILVQAGVTDIDTLCAGLLHDTIEDTGTSYEELAQDFGKRVADIVKECSDDKSLDKVSRKKLQIEHVSSASNSAKLVKLADKISNLSDLLDNPPKKWSKDEIYGYAVWAREVCSRASGLNTNLDARLDKIFAGFGVNKESSKDLEKYYNNILNSE